MADHKLNIADESQAQAELAGQDQSKKVYVVTSENGLFKNGKQYNTGEAITLDERTAENFMNNGDVEVQDEAQ